MRNRSKIQKKERIVQGLRIVPGLAIGPAFLFGRAPLKVDDISYQVTDVPGELKRFDNACHTTVDQLIRAKNISLSKYPKELIEIFDSQIAIIEDKIFLEEIKNEINDYRCSAAEAITRVLKKKKEYFLTLENKYFRDRAHDIEDLKQKLLHSLFGVGQDYQLSIPSIIFTHNLFPSDTVHFNRNLILGFVTDTGGRTSHAAIIARSLSIPYVINNEGLSKTIKERDYSVLDGYNGQIILNPTEKTINDYKKLKTNYQRMIKKLEKETAKPSKTTDGVSIHVFANVEFIHEVEDAVRLGADGVGLFRTEAIFLEKNEIPDEDYQYNIYRRFSNILGDRPLTLRTIDAGGDKILPELEGLDELNPFLGWRAIRFCLDQTHIFESQLRAILRANVTGNIRILIPMISCLWEIVETKNIIEKVKADLKKEKIEFYENTQLGIMIETPAAALLSDIYAPEVDFMSIGTNDLTQYTLAVDRTNQKIAHLFNDLHPAVLRLILQTIKTARDHRIDLSICGELAGNPHAIGALIGLGLRNFSMSPKLIPVIKKVVQSISLKACESLTMDVLQMKTAEDVESRFTEFHQKYLPEDLTLI